MTDEQLKDFMEYFRVQPKGQCLVFSPKIQTATPESNERHFKLSEAIEANTREDTVKEVWE